MSRGRHSRPRAHGGGLATLLALAVAGGAVAVSVTQPDSAALRLCVVGLAAVTAFGLLLQARQQRKVSRALARSEDRLRILEQRSRDEGDELHRRVLESIMREGELRFAVDVLTVEISRLRGSLQGLVEPVGAAAAAVAEWRAEPYPAAALAPAAAVPGAPSTVDIPLVQRVLAAQETVSAPTGQTPVVEWAPAARTLPPVPAQPAPLGVPAPAPIPVPVPVPVDDYETTVRSWVVRELHVDPVAEPVAGLTMRVLDLTSGEGDGPEPDEEPEPHAVQPRYARPA